MRSTVHRFAVAAVVLVLSAPRAAHAQNLLYNPGFEIGNLDGWSSPTGHMPPRSFTPFAHSGLYAAEMPSVYPFNYPGPPNYQQVGQTIATAVGQSYDVSFWAMNTGPNGPIPNNPNGLRIIFGGTMLFDQALTNSTWQLFTVHGTATSTSTWFEIDGFSPIGSNFIDDLTVAAAGPGAGPPTTTPEPATLGLLATGLLALGAGVIARR